VGQEGVCRRLWGRRVAEFVEAPVRMVRTTYN
jgi:hypothetical protein